MRYAMIMAGGAGTRLWPVSRQHLPKQLVRFVPRGGEQVSLLHLAVDRIGDLVQPSHRFICTNESYRGEIRSTIPGIDDPQILGEPVGRDTLNAVGFTAAVLHKRDPEASFAVLSADHLISPEDLFRDRLHTAFEIVDHDPQTLVACSIKPTYPATQFGYVEMAESLDGFANANKLDGFVEKPNLERAQVYLESGVYAWNSGIFVWKASTILDCIRRYKPESYAGLMKIADAWDTPQQSEVLRTVYPELPKISVDYAIMEPASREQARAGKDGVKLATVLLDIDWLDVGSWPSFGETLEEDSHGNRIAGDASFAHLHRTTNSQIVNYEGKHHIALVGCEDLIVVHTADATLVMKREQADLIKKLHAGLPNELR
ncbi:MAG: mannose-1-phosphate guanylyltransferase [Planctomycetota bacterium]